MRELCPVPGCQRIKGHTGFHATSPEIAAREDGIVTKTKTARNPAWLIERKRWFASVPEYVYAISHDRPGDVDYHWTEDANKAIGFATSKDAEIFIFEHLKECVLGRPVEHAWL